MRTFLAVVGLACVAATATGCFGSTELPPPTTVQRTAPPVPRSLDLSAHLDHTCDLFGAEDLIALGLPGKIRPDPPGTGLRGHCGVLDSPSGKRLNLTLRPDRSMVREFYEAEDIPTEYEDGFELLSLRGFPGIRVSYEIGSKVTCVVQVATADRQGLTLSYDSPRGPGDGDAMCAKATVAADAVLRRLGA